MDILEETTSSHSNALPLQAAGHRSRTTTVGLVYSHNHPDHIAGGEGLRDSETQVIAHSLAAEDIIRNRVATTSPNLSFTDQLTIQFEDRSVELRYYGVNNGAESIALFVPDAKFLYVVDWIVLKRLPWMELYYYNLDGMIASIRSVLQLDFAKVSPGHSVVGNKDDVREFLGYLEDLRSAVLKGRNEGKTLPELQKSIKLEKYSSFTKYSEWLPLNIKGAFDQIAQKSGRYGQDK